MNNILGIPMAMHILLFFIATLFAWVIVTRKMKISIYLSLLYTAAATVSILIIELIRYPLHPLWVLATKSNIEQAWQIIWIAMVIVLIALMPLLLGFLLFKYSDAQANILKKLSGHFITPQENRRATIITCFIFISFEIALIGWLWYTGKAVV